ncbi:MAG: hypothetical protein AUH11_05200 [Acidobacteria bacterium 13_2_20CM_57_17]|nr:MAG: hypothetical protein AUH11_05200 [Acidobacteria bacterium 13_2_20CM_57_17]
MAIAGFGETAEQLRRSTVLIHSGGRGSGSGVIWSSDGLIVTNAHVVRGSNVRVQLWDGREFEGAVASRDPRRDLAALRISADSLPAASPADSSQLRPGELAIAIGNPMGFVGALTTGVIHAIGPLPALGSQTWVQASVRLAPGNSGGPLEPDSPAAQASLMAGDILLGTEERRFQSVEDLATAIDGQDSRLLRLEFLRGDYSRVRRVTARLGDSNDGKDVIAA